MSGRSLVLAVVEAIAFADGESPEELDCNLHDYINPDVFYILADEMNKAWEFSFELPDHNVRVTSDKQVFVDGVCFEVDDLSIARNRTWTEEYR